MRSVIPGRTKCEPGMTAARGRETILSRDETISPLSRKTLETAAVYLHDSSEPHPEERALARVSKDGAGSEMLDGAWLYILRCADGSYYVGTTRTSLEIRVAQHNAGTYGGYTKSRRPVELVFSQWFERITDAIENERKLKRWSRAKKDAFMRGDFNFLRQLAKRKSTHPSRDRKSVV